MIGTMGYASDHAQPAKKHAATRKAKTPPHPTIEEEIQALRQELANQAGQIGSLKSDLAEKDAQLKGALHAADEAQARASEAQATADKAQAVVTAQQQAVKETVAAAALINQEAQKLAAPPTPAKAEKQAPAEAVAVAEKAAAPKVNAALTPLRTLPAGRVNHNEAHPPIKVNGVGITPYGFIKLTAVEDSSSPYGDDFPLPGFISDSGSTSSPEFHIKARGTRFGINFDWYDADPRWVITGKVEADFEGNFNRSDNRNISSIRSSNPSIRLAWGRLDYHPNASNTISALFGQDWTIYGSSTIPNILETTGVGIGFGALWERDPQMRFGYTHKFAGFSLTPEFALNLPASGLAPSATNISNELGYGERQGPDSNRPNIQGRIVGQWQLDHASDVAPAQIILSGFTGRRTANVLAKTIQDSSIPASFKAAFPTGVSVSSKQNGWDAEWQLPTRWFTLTGKVYGGADLRWFFGGQLYSFYNDATGLTQVTAATAVSSVDGASCVVFGVNSSGEIVIAPERPVRAAGGFAQLGLPLSRIFNANPAGRNSGWSLYALYGVDQAKTRDLVRAAGTRRYSTMAIGTLNYKLNKWTTFTFEQSLYTTHANPEITLPLYRGVHAREWNDLREEFGPIFTF